MGMDKWLHFIAGYSIYLTFSVGIGNYALIPVVAAGVGKEIYDALHPESHRAEVADVVATVAGGLTGMGLYEGSRAAGGKGYEIPVAVAAAGVIGLGVVQALRDHGEEPESSMVTDLRQLPGYDDIIRDVSLKMSGHEVSAPSGVDDIGAITLLMTRSGMPDGEAVPLRGREPPGAESALYVPSPVILVAVHYNETSPVLPAERTEFSGIAPHLSGEPLTCLNIR